MSDFDGEPDEEALAQLERKWLNGRRLIFIGVPVVLVAVLAIVGVIALLTGGGGDKAQKVAEDHPPEEKITPTIAAAQTKPASDGAPVFCDPVDYLVNLNTAGARVSYLKLQVQFEVLGDQACAQLDSIMPRINGDFQSFLRELRPAELSGSASNHRLKEELLVRVNRSGAETRVIDVHITEFLVQ